MAISINTSIKIHNVFTVNKFLEMKHIFKSFHIPTFKLSKKILHFLCIFSRRLERTNEELISQTEGFQVQIEHLTSRYKFKLKYLIISNVIAINLTINIQTPCHVSTGSVIDVPSSKSDISA